MIATVGTFLAAHPDLALFLVLGVGFWIGSFKFKGFSLGSVTGSLFAGIAFGQLAEIPVSETAKSILFLLFLFGIGYSVGPQFLRAVKGDGLPGVVIGIVVPLTGLTTAVLVARFLGLDPGFAGGLFSGSMTESPAIGTAIEAIKNLPLPDAERQRLVSHVPVADAVCYLFGAVGVILFVSEIGPRLLGIDVVAAARELEDKYGISRRRAGVVSAWRPFELRAYRVATGGRVVGLSVAQAERLRSDARVFVVRVRRDGEIIEATPDTVLRAGDLLAIGGRREVLIDLVTGEVAAREEEDPELLDIPSGSFDVFVSSKSLTGRPLSELATLDVARAVFLRRIVRNDLEIPISPGTTIERGDIVTLIGPETAVELVAAELGMIVRPSDVTDFRLLGLAIFAGGALGVLLTFPVGKVHISLSTSVGTLLAGLFVGWLHSRRPLFGNIPNAAISVMTSLGLAAFVAMVGLHAGPVFFSALREAGIGLLFGGMVVALVPQIVGLLVGRFVLRMNPLLLLGAMAGAQTMTPALAALQARSGSTISVLGYTAAVPFGHILLTSSGSAVVLLVARSL